MTRISPARRRSIAARLLAWYGENARDLPWRRTRDAYAIWISEIMLQQTQVKTVVPYWERWMKALPNVRSLARARPAKILKLWEGLGYYRRARYLQAAAQTIVARHQGEFPRQFAEVLALSGVGRYTAGAICSIAFNQPAPILDGNVIRVLARLGAEQDPVEDPDVKERLWELAEKLVETAQDLGGPTDAVPACSHFNQALMELGALICTPLRPQCERCPLRPLCSARRRHLVDEVPVLPPKKPPTARRFCAAVLVHGNAVLVRRRPAEAVNGNLWEFPNIELAAGDRSAGENWLESWGIPQGQWSRLLSLKHSITRYRMTLEVYTARWPSGRSRPDRGGRWLNSNQLQALAFTSAHRKILHKFLDTRDQKTRRST